MMKKVNVKMAVLSLLMALVMLIGVVFSASMMTTASAATIPTLPETEYVSPTSPTAPTPYDGVPVTPGKINSSNYRTYGLTDENWQQYNGYYAIRNSKELYGFAALTRAQSTVNLSAVLLADIVINTSVSTSTGATYQWDPLVHEDIGDVYKNGFGGTFDGNGYSISGIYMESSGNLRGIFGSIAGSGVVKNLVLKNSVFKNHANGSAVFAHRNYGMIIFCRVESSVIVTRTGKSSAGVSGIAWVAKTTQTVGSKRQTFTGGIENCFSNVTMDVYRAEDNESLNENGVIATELESVSKVNNNYGIVSNGYPLIGNKNYDSAGKWTTLKTQNDAHTCIPITHNQVNGTCYSSGLSAYTFCAVCEKILSGEKTVLYGHSTTETFYTLNKADNSKHDKRCMECTEILGTEKHTYNSNVDIACKDCAFTFLTLNEAGTEYTLNQTSFTLSHNLILSKPLTIPQGCALTVAEGVTLTLQEQLTNNGSLINNGGTVVKDGFMQGTGSVTCGENATHHPAFNDDGFCAFCGDEEYPEAAPLVDGYYQIGNVGQLMWFSNFVGQGNGSANAKLTADIIYNAGDLSGLNGKNEGYRFWTPIGMIMNHETGIDTFVTYTGTFDGDGHTVSGLYHFDYWSYGGFAGLVSKLGAGGVIKNVTVKNSYIATSSYAGAILGENLGGIVENCHNVNTTVASAARVGGIVGDNRTGTVRYCTNKGNVKFFKVNSGLAFSFGEFGGIAGNTTGTIEYCTNYGDIVSAEISGVGGITGQIYQGIVRNCVNEGDINVSGGTNFGGITGYQYHGTLSHNINYGTIAGGNLVGGIIGNPLGNGGRYTHNYTVGGNAFGIGNWDGCFSITEAELANGRLAFELGIGQEIGKDARPSVGAPAVYAYFNESGVVNYTNDANYICHHAGGTATCNERAVCAGCRNPYGEIPTGAHEFHITGREDMHYCLVCGGRCGVVAPHNTNYIDYCAVCGDWIGPALAEDGFYEIKTFGNLMWFADQVNAGNYDLNARLISNISYGSTFRTTKWTPIAGSSISDTTVGYRGIFDGQGHSISLFPQTELLTPEYDGAVLGLFGTLADGAVVKNLSISNRVEITFNRGGPDYTYGGEYTVYFGLVAGRVLEGATVSGCRVANGTVSISKGVLGAIVGVNYGTVENCVSYNMTLTGPEGHVGGIVGDYNGGELINCYTTYASLGSVASGYVGTATDSEAGVSDERIASGEIAYTMNTYIGNPSFWYQTVGSGGPVGRSEYNVVDKIVYLHNLGDIVFYSNNEFKVVIKSDYTIPAGKTFLLPSGTTLEIAQNVTLTNEGTLIVNGVLTGKGTLAGNGAFQITDLDAEDITIPADFTFDGTEHYDAVVEGLESKLVIMGKTFSVEGYTRTFNFTSVKNAGEYTVTYTAEHETLTYSFNVMTLVVLDSDVSLDTTIFDYNGHAHEPSVVLAGIEVELGRDYYVTYSDNVSAGEVSVTITFRGNLSGEFTRNFTILPVAIGEKVSVEYATEMLFTGVELNPIAVSIGGVQLVRDVDYTVTFENNVYPGTATAKVVGIGSVSGEMDISFEILKPVFTVTVFDQNLPYNEDSNIKPFDQTMYEGEGLVEGHTVVLGESGGAGEMITVLQILDANGVDVLEYYDLTVEMGKYHMFSERYIQDGSGYHWRDCIYNCDAKIDYEEHHGGIVTCSENGRCVDCGITYLWATGEHTYENGICTGCDYNPGYVLVLDQDGNGQHNGTEEGLGADSIHNIFSRPELQYVVVKDFEGVFAGVGQDNTTIVLDLFGHTIDMTNAPYGFTMQANNLVVIFKSTSQESGTLIGKTIVAYESVVFTLDNVRHEGILDNSGTIYVQNGAVLYSEITNDGIIYLPAGYDLSTIVSYEGRGTLYVGDMAFAYNEESGKLECATDHIWSDADCTIAKTCSRCGATDGDPLGHDTEGPATCEDDEYCTRCDSVITEKFGHTPKTIPEQEPTCDEVGYSESTVCANCDHVYVPAVETPALGHTEEAPVAENVVEAVCGVAGSYETVIYCAVCEDELSREFEIIPALEHNDIKSVHEKREASCTEDGYVIYAYTCTLCGDVRYSEQMTLVADGHTAGEEQIVEQAAPNCKNDGFIKSVVQCTVCGETLQTNTQIIPAEGHTPDIEVPTCAQAQYCTVCHELIQANVPHNYEDTVVEADCYLAGGINHVCKDCNTGYFEVTQEALGHNPDKKAPTCTEDVICTRCDEILEFAIGHKDVWATCTTPHYCSTCQEEFAPANGHIFNDTDVPDCTRDKYCVVCNHIEAEKLGHDPDREAPTCTEHVRCTRCPAVLELATDHTYNNEDGATCTEDYYCITCGEVLAEKMGHLPTYPEAQCENENLCIRCDEVLEAAVGHDYQSEVLAEPDCYRAGEVCYTCTRCGDSYFETTPQFEHDPVLQEGRPSTCTQQGYIGATVCSLCGTVLAPQEPLPFGDHIDQNADGACDACGFSEECIHAWDEGVINPLPTCIESGVKTFTCSVCGEIKTESIEAAGHSHQATVTNPTCTEQGYTTHACHCGDSYVTDITDALGHTEQTIAGKAATCTEAGLTDGKKCSVCGEISVEQSSIPALGHSYSEATCTAKATCSVCQDVRGEFAEHVDGNSDGKCDACEHQMMPTIPEESTSEQPEETTPSVPEESTPSVPEESTPSVPEESTPSVPEESTPSVPEESTPSVPEESTPSVPEESTPSVPEESTPSVPEESTPSVPEETTPEQPEETTPSVPEENIPEQPEEEPKEGLSGGAIAGIVAGSTATVGVGGFSLFWFVIKKKRFSDLLKIITGK